MTPSDHELSLPLLTYILDSLLAKGLHLLYRQDYLGRIPLHYACEYGLADLCEVFLESMKAWDLSGAGGSRSAILLRDMQSRSPLQLSVPGGHPEVTRLLIKFFGHDYSNHNKTFFSRFSTAAGELLLFAVRSNSTEALTSLLGTDIDINCCDALGQTPLYLAARSGNESFVHLLLPYKPLLDTYETVKSWTPLIIASLEGFSAIIEVLLKHGANVEHRDLLGWTAIDHASYRGHIPLAKALVNTTKSLNHKQAMEIQYQLKTSLRQKLLSRGRPRRTSSAKERHIVVNLGSLDLSDTTPAVRLSPHLIENPSIMHPESLFSLGVSIVGRASPSHIIPLPLLEDATNTPWIFTTTDPTDAKLAFEILRNEPATTEDRELIGRGMCLLASYKRSPHTKRESLNRDYTVPILSTATLEYIGAVTFSLIISTPLVLPNTPPINTEELWFENGPSKVVGHRGIVLNY
jgi:glycerophosphodiester phosphodiesterase